MLYVYMIYVYMLYVYMIYVYMLYVYMLYVYMFENAKKWARGWGAGSGGWEGLRVY